MNYCDLLFNLDNESLGSPVLIDADSGMRFTFRELQIAVENVAGVFHDLNWRPGNVIATHIYNSAEAVLAHLAIQYFGGVTCLLDPLITPAGLDYYVRDAGAKALITHLPSEIASNHLSGDVGILNSGDILGMAAAKKAPATKYEFDHDELSSIFYTSGTTSQPKGVMLSPGAYFNHVEIFHRGCYQYESTDKLLCFVPFSHGYGSKSIFLPALQGGAAMVIMRSFHPLRVVEIIEQENITHIFGVPSHYQQLLRREEFFPALRKLKAAFSAAALLKLETAQEWHEKIGFYLDEGYGLIETSTGIAFRRNRIPLKLGHVGKYPHDLIDIEIVGESMNTLPANERGEIVVRGKSIMLGYLNKLDETTQALRDNWFRTGDMGYKTEDGELILTGRIKDIINVAGIKVAPFEVEAVLNEHPAVNESAVIGIDDEMYGEVVHAFVKLNGKEKTDERDLVRFLQTKLMNFQAPRRIDFLESFPRNNMGKIDKNALRLSML